MRSSKLIKNNLTIYIKLFLIGASQYSSQIIHRFEFTTAVHFASVLTSDSLSNVKCSLAIAIGS